MFRFWRVQVLAMTSLLAVAGVGGLVAAAIAGSQGGVLFLTAWLLVLAWNAYWFLIRIAYRLDVTDTELRWVTPLRHGALQLSELIEMRPQRFSSNVEVLLAADGSKVLVMVRKGFVAFSTDLKSVAPHVKVRVGITARISDKLPGTRGYRRS